MEALIKRLLIGLPFVLGATIALVALIVSQASAPRSGEAGPPTCADSFATFGQGAGHWEGTWNNPDFQSSGSLSMDVSINDDCTLQATIDGVFGQPGPVIVNATYRDGNSTIVDIVGDPVFGDATITVADDGALTLTGTGLHQGIESVAATGTVTTTQISLEVTLTFEGGGTAMETVELTRDISDTPTPSATPTPSPTDTPAPTATAASGQQVTWADNNCKDGVNPVDSLLVLRADAGLSANTNECPAMGASIDVLLASLHTWGNVDCKDGMTPVDSLKILRFDAGLSASQEEGCPAMGSAVTITLS